MWLVRKRLAIFAESLPGTAPTTQVSGSARTDEAVASPGNCIGNSAAVAAGALNRRATRAAAKARVTGDGNTRGPRSERRLPTSLHSPGGRLHPRHGWLDRLLSRRRAAARGLLEALGARDPRLEADPLAR